MDPGGETRVTLGLGWLTAAHYRPPLLVASVCFAVQSWSLLDSDIGLWPADAPWFWPVAFATASVVCALAVRCPDRPSRFVAACTIAALELSRASVIFAEFGADVSHIIARHVLVAFLAAYLLLDD